VEAAPDAYDAEEALESLYGGYNLPAPSSSGNGGGGGGEVSSRVSVRLER
jgi:hypothetical protein